MEKKALLGVPGSELRVVVREAGGREVSVGGYDQQGQTIWKDHHAACFEKISAR